MSKVIFSERNVLKVEDIIIPKEKSLEELIEAWKSGAITLLGDIPKPEHDLYWCQEAIRTGLINHGEHTPLKNTEAYKKLRLNMFDDNYTKSKEGLLRALVEFVVDLG